MNEPLARARELLCRPVPAAIVFLVVANREPPEPVVGAPLAPATEPSAVC